MAAQPTQKIFNLDFIISFLALFAFSSTYNLLIPTLPIYLAKSGSTEVEIGLLIGILGLASMVLRPFVGRGLLKTPEKKYMIGGAILLTASSAGYLVAPPFWPLLMVRVLHGVGMAYSYTASVTLVARITPEAYRGRILSYFYLSFQLSFAWAPSFGMFLINNFGSTLLFLVCLGLSSTALLITLKLKESLLDPLEERPVKQDTHFFNRKSLPPAIMTFMVSIVWGGTTAFFPLYALDHGVANPGFFFSISAIMIILGRSLGARILDLYSRESVILPCLTVYVISMIMLAFSKTLPMFVLVAVIWGIGQALIIPVLTAYALDLGGSSRGTAMGTFSAFDDLGLGMGPVIMGIGLRLTNYQTMFLFLAFTGMINIGYSYFVTKKNDPSIYKA